MVPSPDLEGTILSSMIMDQTYFYSWTEIDDQMYGAKVAIVDMKKDENNTSQSVTHLILKLNITANYGKMSMIVFFTSKYSVVFEI